MIHALLGEVMPRIHALAILGRTPTEVRGGEAEVHVQHLRAAINMVLNRLAINVGADPMPPRGDDNHHRDDNGVVGAGCVCVCVCVLGFRFQG